MTQLVSRSYNALADLTRLIEFIRSVRPAALHTEYPGLYELPELLSIPQNQATARLWLSEEGQLVAFAYVDAFYTLRFDLDWQTQNQQMEREILAWGNEHLKGKHPWLFTTSHETDRDRLRFLGRHGFVPCRVSIIHMTCSLSAEIPGSPVPAGFMIRSVTGEEEAPAIAALHRAAFRTAHMTAERRITIMRQREYDPDLDLVAVAEDGTLAAYALGQVNEEEETQGIAYADLFATHPKYRGRGLASTLIRMLLKRLRAKGYRLAKLSTDGDNTPMRDVAGKSGFQIAGKTLRFKRPVELA